MPKLTIDNCNVHVEQETSILDAAKKLGINIPTLCDYKGLAPTGSCMVCLVKVNNSEQFVPSCATMVEDAMVVESETPQVRQARRGALELLLSDHLGDCLGPCQMICPAHMNIPLMIRQISAGRLGDAIATIKQEIPLPAVLGRICAAPCEKGCRRAVKDNPVSICLLTRYAADTDLAADDPYLPARKPDRAKRIAIVGAGPAGLAAAYYLLRAGYASTIIDERKQPGGMLRYGVPETQLPRCVLDAEIDQISKLGLELRMGTRIDQAGFDQLKNDFDAVLLAAGNAELDFARGLEPDKKTHQTDMPSVFALPARKTRQAIRAIADGKAAAFAIDQYLSDVSVTGMEKPFNTQIGRLKDGEMELFMISAAPHGRIVPAGGATAGLSEDEARAEAIRCLHCDCRKQDDCKLREYARKYQARPNRYRDDRRLFEQQLQHPDVIYEPGKCIACGICIRIAEKAREPLGLTFVGRGFDVRVAVPFNESTAEGLKNVADECAAACPTAALARKGTI